MKTIGCCVRLWLLVCLSMLFAGLVSAQTADDAVKNVTAITASGNVQIPEKDILAVIKEKPGDTFAGDRVKQDLQSVYEMGYFSRVTTQVMELPEGIALCFVVVENPVLKGIVFKGNTKIATERLMSLLTVPKEQIVNSRVLDENIRAIEQFYHDQGYILAKTSDVALDSHGILTITLNEGLLEGIEVKGNEKTKTYVITREMKVKPGEPLNAKDLKRSMQKVYNLGFFEDVNSQLKPGREPNSVVLETKVVEQKTQVYSLGGTYSDSEGLTGFIEIGDKNFRGTGDDMLLHWEFGGNAANGRNYEFTYKHPWLDKKQTAASFGIMNMTNRYHDYDANHIRSTYDKKRQGWNVTLSRPQGEYITNSITLKNYKDMYVRNISGEDYNDGTWEHQEYLKHNFGVTHSVSLSRVYDSRDNVFQPSEGKRLAFTTEFSGRFLGGDFNYNKYSAEGRYYCKAGKNNVWAFRFNVGYATGTMPDGGKFSVGGADTLRGYDDDEFKGNKMIIGSVEYRVPLGSKVQGVMFSDIGKAWDTDGLSLHDLKKSAGVGVRFNSPLGPIRFDYAWGSEGKKPHFSFGGQF